MRPRACVSGCLCVRAHVCDRKYSYIVCSPDEIIQLDNVVSALVHPQQMCRRTPTTETVWLHTILLVLYLLQYDHAQSSFVNPTCRLVVDIVQDRQL